MLYFENLRKEYPGGFVALDDINLTIDKGELVSIVGHSGAGKTTLIKMILAEEKPTYGRVSFHSSQVNKLKGKDLTDFRRKIGVVFQDYRLLKNKTVFENIAFAMEASGKTDEEIARDVPNVLDLVDLRNKIFHFPDQLSGGEKQRVVIARALVNRPEILIADEPTGNLDPVNTYDIIQVLKKINDLGTTVILTTHNKGVIDHLKKRVVTMQDGRILKDERIGKYAI
ncbi:MAG TPA: cell division ATP-binding protein FtsE [Candidatus Paceibacterota bacterium]|nr:cell division ATP-binding protein FtsE [Candidatus Paceibacterota bacterium]HPX52273.1 cell division ATP-binding protein FtsE [Candidatus Paceibacterota bacterium]HQB56988.1 cell division ATP-binding protein FtsE [Candidatus Paceibacterota bacterium]